MAPGGQGTGPDAGMPGAPARPPGWRRHGGRRPPRTRRTARSHRSATRRPCSAGRFGPALQGCRGQHRVLELVVLPAAEGGLGQEPPGQSLRGQRVGPAGLASVQRVRGEVEEHLAGEGVSRGCKGASSLTSSTMSAPRASPSSRTRRAVTVSWGRACSWQAYHDGRARPAAARGVLAGARSFAGRVLGGGSARQPRSRRERAGPAVRVLDPGGLAGPRRGLVPWLAVEQTTRVESPEIRYARSGDVHIAYSVVGDGPIDVVFVSGWVLSNFGTPWEGSAADFYRGMSSFARLVLFDKRGIGMSDRTHGIPDLETRMDDIRAVMDAIGSRRAAIMGFSEGGAMSMLFAATYPERTAALVLYSTPVSWFRTRDYPWAATREEWRAFLQSEEGVRGTDEWCDAELRGLAPTTADDPATRRWWRRWVQSSASPGAIKAMSLMNSEIDVSGTLSSIRVPALALNRTDDE